MNDGVPAFFAGTLQNIQKLIENHSVEYFAFISYFSF